MTTDVQMLEHAGSFEEYYAYSEERMRLSTEYDGMMVQQYGDRLI